MKTKSKTLCKNEWLSLMELDLDGNKYVYSHESRCNGIIVAILPYRFKNDKISYLLRKEITPCWGIEPNHSALTGGLEEGLSPIETVLKELKEESGYSATEDDLIILGKCFGTKSTDTRYYLFSVDLTGKKPGKKSGDGTIYDDSGTCVWTKEPYLCNDPIASVMYCRLFKKLGEMAKENDGLS